MSIGTTAAIIAASAAVASGAVGELGAIRQGQAAERRSEFDIVMLERQRRRDEQIGKLNASRVRKDAAKLAGTQRALMAGGGGDQSTGSALLIQTELAKEGEFNAQLAESNAEAAISTRNAQIVLARASGRNARTASFYRAGTALLRSGFTAAETFV